MWRSAMFDKDKPKFLWLWLPDVCVAALLLVSVSLSVLMVMGCLHLGFSAVYSAFRAAHSVSWLDGFFASDEVLGIRPHSHPITPLLGALEYFLLAPIAYVLLRTLFLYVTDVARNPTGIPRTETAHALSSLKGLVTGLLIAVLATHLVGEVLQSTHSDGGQPSHFPWVAVLSSSCLILVLVLYYHCIGTHLVTSKETPASAQLRQAIQDYKAAHAAPDKP